MVAASTTSSEDSIDLSPHIRADSISHLTEDTEGMDRTLEGESAAEDRELERSTSRYGDGVRARGPSEEPNVERVRGGTDDREDAEPLFGTEGGTASARGDWVTATNRERSPTQSAPATSAPDPPREGLLLHPRPVRPPILQGLSNTDRSRPSTPSSPIVLPSKSPKGKRRFSRTISQLSLGSLKSLSRPTTPSSSRKSSIGLPAEDADMTVIRDKGKAKAKLRELFRFDSSHSLRSKSRPGTPIPGSDYALSSPSIQRIQMRHRSQSAPLPFVSHAPSQSLVDTNVPHLVSIPATEPYDEMTLDNVPDSSASTPFHSAVSTPRSNYFSFTPKLGSLPYEPPRDLFAYYLPLELQIRVMKMLLEVCDEDWRREERDGTWKGAKARERWSDGEARGRRELVRIGRVSKTWRRLSLDSQLWQNGPAAATLGADVLAPEAIISLFEASGPSIRQLNLQGFGKSLDSRIFERIFDATTGFAFDGTTNLRTIKFRGCNSLSPRSIQSLLSCSPQLVSADLFALLQVGPTHLAVLASKCPRLTSLNVSRCRNLPASAMLTLCESSQPSGPSLKFLSVSALSGMTNDIFFEIFANHPSLEHLDISFSPLLTDTAFDRITTLPTSSPSPPSPPTYLARPSHRASRSNSLLLLLPKRSFPALRYLNLSGCTSLTSLSLSHLTLSQPGSTTPISLVPSLSHLELSRLSPSFDAPSHLSSFLSSIVQTLTHLDLEDGINLSDTVLEALLPPQGSQGNQGQSKLETLILNSCERLTDQGIAKIVRGCSRSKVLEVDGTEVSDRTAREFVKLLNERQEKEKDQSPGDEEGVAREDEEIRKKRGPFVLSILDNRLTGRRLHRDVGTNLIRPRIGYRGYWTGAAVGFYHDGYEDETEREQELASRAGGGGGDWKNRLEECQGDKIVVRSFYSSLEVDAANAARRMREEKKTEVREKGKGALRIRALSDSVLRRDGEETEGDARERSRSVGCSIM